MKKNQMIHVLMVDDDAEDINLMLELLNSLKGNLNIQIANNGTEAIRMLKEKNLRRQKLPDLIFLGLSMTNPKSLKALEDIKGHEAFKHLPVIVLISSKHDKYFYHRYRHGANCFLTKPNGLADFQRVQEAISNFWFKEARLPIYNEETE
ncbi:MAG: response regulator [Bacteroidales bacterium]|nr:response regulator [Bacteroidales bacterium]